MKGNFLEANILFSNARLHRSRPTERGKTTESDEHQKWAGWWSQTERAVAQGTRGKDIHEWCEFEDHLSDCYFFDNIRIVLKSSQDQHNSWFLNSWALYSEECTTNACVIHISWLGRSPLFCKFMILVHCRRTWRRTLGCPLFWLEEVRVDREPTEWTTLLLPPHMWPLVPIAA